MASYTGSGQAVERDQEHNGSLARSSCRTRPRTQRISLLVKPSIARTQRISLMVRPSIVNKKPLWRVNQAYVTDQSGQAVDRKQEHLEFLFGESIRCILFSVKVITKGILKRKGRKFSMYCCSQAVPMNLAARKLPSLLTLRYCSHLRMSSAVLLAMFG